MNIESTCWHFFVVGLKPHKLRAPYHFLTLRSPRLGVGFLPRSTVTPPWLVKWGTLPSGVSSFLLQRGLIFLFLSFAACDGVNISGR